jgi:hypothetical protein
MATLKITAKADVRSAKASIRELTQEEANLLAKEKEANLQRRLDSQRTAQERVRLARASGTASRQEIAELRLAERIANTDARIAAREASRAARDEIKRRFAEERREIEQTIRSVQEYARELRKLKSTLPAGPGVSGRGGIGGGTGGGGIGGGIGGRLGRLGRFAGPGAVAGIGFALAAANGASENNESSAIQKTASDAVNSGDAQTELMKSAKDAGMKDEDIATLLHMTGNMKGVKSTVQLSAIAKDVVENESASLPAIYKRLLEEANPKEITPQQKAAGSIHREQRQGEIDAARLREWQSRALSKIRTDNKLQVQRIEGNDSTWGEFSASALGMVAGDEKADRMRAWANGKQESVVSLSKETLHALSVQQRPVRPLSGD